VSKPNDKPEYLRWLNFQQGHTWVNAVYTGNAEPYWRDKPDPDTKPASKQGDRKPERK
jgi:hypothetical protein